jgi:hypothetical protein
VIQVNATDLDAPNTPNSRINYMISSGSKEKFLIDPNSGIIRIANSNTRLDRDIYGSNYTLKVVANDYGATNVNTNDLADNYCLVFIDVIDVNDKKPKFDAPLRYSLFSILSSRNNKVSLQPKKRKKKISKSPENLAILSNHSNRDFY